MRAGVQRWDTWFAAVPIGLGMRGSEGYGQEVLVAMSGRQPRKAK